MVMIMIIDSWLWLDIVIQIFVEVNPHVDLLYGSVINLVWTLLFRN